MGDIMQVNEILEELTKLKNQLEIENCHKGLIDYRLVSSCLQVIYILDKRLKMHEEKSNKVIIDLDDYLEIKLKRYNGIENTIENHIPRID